MCLHLISCIILTVFEFYVYLRRIRLHDVAIMSRRVFYLAFLRPEETYIYALLDALTLS